MLGYTKEDLDTMIDSIATALLSVDDTDDPWLHGNLNRTKEFLEGILAEGHVE